MIPMIYGSLACLRTASGGERPYEDLARSRSSLLRWADGWGGVDSIREVSYLMTSRGWDLWTSPTGFPVAGWAGTRQPVRSLGCGQDVAIEFLNVSCDRCKSFE